jgi:hypothetical protein
MAPASTLADRQSSPALLRPSRLYLSSGWFRRKPIVGGGQARRPPGAELHNFAEPSRAAASTRTANSADTLWRSLVDAEPATSHRDAVKLDRAGNCTMVHDDFLVQRRRSRRAGRLYIGHGPKFISIHFIAPPRRSSLSAGTCSRSPW